MSLTPEEQAILDKIVIHSENNPNKPEFPANNPKFPATPTYKIDVPGFSNVWLKDESHNPTGTHKDRMAWEVVTTYRSLLLSKKRGQISGPLPHMSLISSGSAAPAVQTQLRAYNLPYLKVLVDAKLSPDLVTKLEKLGCEVYKTDLSKKAFNSEEILAMTNNQDGFDLTSAEALDPSTRFYDWLSYEIVNESPEYCFIPFGTGHLYENILNVNQREVSAKKHDPRFSGDPEILRRCNFMGATTSNPDTKAEKLYSPHLPFSHLNEQWMRLYRSAGYCGPETNVYTFQESFLDEALKLAHTQGITCEPSGISGLALMLQMKDELPRDKKMLIVNTGKVRE